MKRAALTLIAISLFSGCVEVEPEATRVSAPIETAGEASSETANRAGSASWQEFINTRSATTDLGPISLARTLDICRALVASNMQFAPVLDKFGLPNTWKNNGGDIETASWLLAANTAGINSFAIFYKSDGSVRNATFFGDKGAFLGGIQTWMTPAQYCVPGVTYSR